jgi:hypothetical protein
MEALVLEFNSWYGTDNGNLRSWQNLCKAIRIYPLPETCELCCEVRRPDFSSFLLLISDNRLSKDAS